MLRNEGINIEHKANIEELQRLAQNGDKMAKELYTVAQGNVNNRSRLASKCFNKYKYFANKLANIVNLFLHAKSFLLRCPHKLVKISRYHFMKTFEQSTRATSSTISMAELIKELGTIDGIPMVSLLKSIGIKDKIKFVDDCIYIPSSLVKHFGTFKALLSFSSKTGRVFNPIKNGEEIKININEYPITDEIDTWKLEDIYESDICSWNRRRMLQSFQPPSKPLVTTLLYAFAITKALPHDELANPKPKNAKDMSNSSSYKKHCSKSISESHTFCTMVMRQHMIQLSNQRRNNANKPIQEDKSKAIILRP